MDYFKLCGIQWTQPWTTFPDWPSSFQQTHQGDFLKDCVGADRWKKLKTFLKPTLMLECKDVNMKLNSVYCEFPTKFWKTYHWRILHQLQIKAAEGHNKQHSMNGVKAVQPLPSFTSLTTNIIQPVCR